MTTPHVKRTEITLHPDRTRVLARPFRPMSDQRAVRICARVMSLSEGEVHTLLEQVLAEFGERHLNVEEFLRRQFDQVRPHVLTNENVSEEREMLLGAYFTHEYSLEAAALFNPSIVPHPDQSRLPPGSLRFILSLRATAEGHISSITFRTGLLDANNNISIDVPTRYSLEPAQVPNATFEKRLFERKLQEIGLTGDFKQRVLEGLGDTFSLKELIAHVRFAVNELTPDDKDAKRVAKEIVLLAQSNYEVQFAAEVRRTQPLSLRLVARALRTLRLPAGFFAVAASILITTMFVLAIAHVHLERKSQITPAIAAITIRKKISLIATLATFNTIHRTRMAMNRTRSSDVLGIRGCG